MPSTPEPKQPKPTAAHRRLEVFIGDWHAEGTSYGDGQDAADPRAAGVTSSVQARMTVVKAGAIRIALPGIALPAPPVPLTRGPTAAGRRKPTSRR